MKNLLLVALLLVTVQLQSQTKVKYNYGELGFLFGVTNYSGDVSQAHIELNETRAGFGAFYRYRTGKHLSFKAHIYSGLISGDDKNSNKPKIQQRSFRFSTSILECGLVGEWNFIGAARFTANGLHSFSITPYVFGGVGAAITSAKAEYYGPPELRNDYLETPLPEEGLDHNFFSTPMGGGIRVDMFDRFIIGGEVGWRPVYSDDLDGIKINGNPLKGDWYYFAGLTLSYILENHSTRYGCQN